MGKINKYYTSKAEEGFMELTFDEEETKYFDFKWKVLSELFAEMQLKHNKRFFITQEEYDDDDGLFGISLDFDAFPTVKYKYKGKTNKMEILLYATIRFSLKEEDDNYIKFKVIPVYNNSVIGNRLFNKRSGIFGEKSGELNLPHSFNKEIISRFLKYYKSHIRKGKRPVEIKDDLHKIFKDTNKTIFELLDQIQDHSDIEFLISPDWNFSDKEKTKEEGFSFEEEYEKYISLDEFDADAYFREITDEKEIRNLKINRHFK
ncbi:hypothetical protein [Staphylococcus phage vB_StaM_SA1]|nr:hypothetical protein [Staphylococcus phage vB_StaM_SA1]